MNEPNDYRQSYLKNTEIRNAKKPLQTVDILANICAHLVLLTGIISFAVGIYYTVRTDVSAGITLSSLYLIISLLVYALTQMIRAIFKKIVWEQDNN